VTLDGGPAWRCTTDDIKVLLDLEDELLKSSAPVDAAPAADAPKAWRLKDSVFAPRARECDSKDYTVGPDRWRMPTLNPKP
jgi:hypothetical protein